MYLKIILPSVLAIQMNRKGEAVVREAVMGFVSRYGLLGFLTALPTTPSFMDYEAVYLPKNHFIRAAPSALHPSAGHKSPASLPLPE